MSADLTLKYIRDLLGVSRVAVDYWKRVHGLPVRKHPETGFVHLRKDEFEAWMQKMRETLPAVARYLARKEGRDSYRIVKQVTSVSVFKTSRWPNARGRASGKPVRPRWPDEDERTTAA